MNILEVCQVTLQEDAGRFIFPEHSRLSGFPHDGQHSVLKQVVNSVCC